MEQDAPVEIGRRAGQRKRRFRVGQTKGSAIPMIATATETTPTVASTDRPCDLIGSRRLLFATGAALLIIKCADIIINLKGCTIMENGAKLWFVNRGVIHELRSKQSSIKLP